MSAQCPGRGDPCRADDRRLGLRGRGRHPGRPEGVRALRRARDERDHGDHRPEHGRRRRGPSGAAGDRARAGAGGRARHRRGCRQGGDARHGRVTLAVARALDELPAGTPVVVDPVMVAESGARLLDADAQGALDGGDRAARERADAEPARGARARRAMASDRRRSERGGAERGSAGAGAGGARAGARAVVLTGGHRARAVDLFLDAEAGGEGRRRS